MKRIYWILAVVCFCCCLSCVQVHARTTSKDEKYSGIKSGVFTFSYNVGRYPVLMYIPNRIFDLFDIVRFRVRIGPGLSIGARVTEVIDLFMGSHATGYIGLRGARGKPQIPWPLGLEKNEGIEFSIADVTDDGRHAPYVDPLEVSVQTQTVIAGFYVGVEVFEIVDFLTGMLFLDVQDDDF